MLIDQVKKLPENPGIIYIAIQNMRKILYANNLKKDLGKSILAYNMEKSDLKILGFDSTKTFIEALETAYKISRKENVPIALNELFGHSFYLAINYFSPPFFLTRESTIEDYTYIGPFSSIFEIWDIIYTFAALIKTPACETENFPCEKLKNKSCYGFCLIQDRNKFFDDMNSYYLQANTELLLQLESQYNDLFNTLQFEKADLLMKQTNLIKNFYDKLAMFKIMKNYSATIMSDDREITFEKGFIRSIKQSGKTEQISFITHPEYNENEALALDKSQYYELKLNYDFLKRINKLEDK